MAARVSLTTLKETIIACRKCPRLVAWREQTACEKRAAFRDEEYWGKPVPGFGDPKARLLVVGLAPAAHGGNRTGRIFTGDSSGSWLYAALHKTGFSNQPDSTGRDDGLTLTDCYVTAAAHCAPPENRPTRQELDACQSWLESEIRLLPTARVVVALGRIGWERWLRASGWWARLSVRERPRFGHGLETRMPDGTLLITSYHPSRQNTHTGKLTRPMWEAIFRRARAVLDEERAAGETHRKSARPRGRTFAASSPPKGASSIPPSGRRAATTLRARDTSRAARGGGARRDPRA